MIYVDNTYKTEVKCNINMYEHWEGLLIEIKGGSLSNTITIGSIYRPPKTTNDSLNVFIDQLAYTLSSLENNNNQLILAGDFNINLLILVHGPDKISVPPNVAKRRWYTFIC